MNYTNIEWTDFTWNPVTGCYHGCEYCYARRIAHRFRNQDEESEKTAEWAKENNMVLETKSKKDPYPLEFVPTFHKNRLDQPGKRKKPAKIFVSSMGDLFGEWVPEEWIKQVIEVAEKCPHHTFQFLTKNPGRYYDFDFPDNCWLGTSVDGKDFRTDHEKVEIMEEITENITFLSVEPLLGNVEDHVGFSWCDWVIIGAQTGPGAKKPKAWWIDQIFKNYRGPIFLKDNLDWPEEIKEWPKGADDNIK